MRSGFVVLLLAATSVGCLSDPKFEQTNEDTTSTTASTEPTGDMVLVPATSFSTLSTRAADGKAKGKDKDKDKGDDDDDAPAPPPSPAPKPEPSTPPASPSSPAPQAPASSTVVPAFWMDAAPVWPDAYAACESAGVCTPPTCSSVLQVACVTRRQAFAFCAWKKKRLVRNDEWEAAVKQSPAGLTGLSGGHAEWVEADTGLARGGATSSASTPLGLESSMPNVGFRCARDR